VNRIAAPLMAAATAPKARKAPAALRLPDRTAHATTSSPATAKPVREYVSESGMRSSTEINQPITAQRLHPHKKGSTAQIAAAAWLGL
jgi:hypothetical protein